jgi:hypothetical protein
MSRCAVEESLNAYYRGIDKDESMLDNFNSDIEPIIDEISVLVEKIKDIERGYEDYDYNSEIKQQVMDLL